MYMYYNKQFMYTCIMINIFLAHQDECPLRTFVIHLAMAKVDVRNYKPYLIQTNMDSVSMNA